MPHGIWLRLDADAQPEDVLESVSRLQVLPGNVVDLRAILDRDGQRLERVGIFGMLSVAFITGAFLAALGLLLYTSVSIVRRARRFAVLRAVGMHHSELMRTVSVEYLITLVYGIMAGTALGIVSSILFVPFFALTETAAVPIPPFIPYIGWGEARLMAAIMGITLLVIEAGVLLRLLRTKVFEALRMG